MSRDAALRQADQAGRRHVDLLILAVLFAGSVLVVGRCYVASLRADEVMRRAQLDPTTYRRAALAALDGREGADAAALVPLLRPAFTDYQRRSRADRKALPPSPDRVTPESLAALRSLSDAGNARAACVLAVQLARCEFNLRWRRQEWEESAGSLAGHRLPCDGLTTSDGETAWQLLLRSALLGHPEGVWLLTSWGRYESADWGDRLDVRAAQLRFGRPLIDALALMGDVSAMSSMVWNYGELSTTSEQYYGDLRVFPGKPDRALVAAYLRERTLDSLPPWLPDVISSRREWGKQREQLEEKLGAAERVAARKQAEVLLAKLPPRAIEADEPEDSDGALIPHYPPWVPADAACRR